MKKLILICIIFFASINSYAQSNSEEMGDAAFFMGNYADAIELYDAAAILSKERTTEIQTKRSKAVRCLSLKKTGDSFYSSEAYGDAKAKYQQLLSLNPSDKSAKERLGKLGKLIALSKEKDAKIQELKRIDEAYYDALKSGVGKLENFCEKYSDSEHIHKATIVINALKYEEYPNISTEISLYNLIGSDFMEIGDIDKARKFYDYSASFADPEGLYLKALTYSHVSKAYITLMAMSASSGYEPAIEKLQGVPHNSKIAQIYYSHLKGYTANLLSAIFVKENAQTYYLDSIDPGKYIMEDKVLSLNLTELQSLEVDGNLAYYIADMVKDDAGFSDSRIVLLYYAASDGNADATYQLAKKAALDENADSEMANALYLCAMNGGVAIREKSWKSEDVMNYVSFMKNGKAINSWELYLVSENPIIHLGTGVINKHEALLNCCQMVSRPSQYKWFKQFWKENNVGIWDKGYITRVINYLSERDDTTSKKMRKKVSKLKLKDGIYTSELAEFIKDGFVDNQYRYFCPVFHLNVLMKDSINDHIGENGIAIR